MARILGIVVGASLIAAGAFAVQNSKEIPPYKNPKLSVDQRVEDLLKRMTLEEKLNQIRCDIREDIWVKALKTTGFGEVYDILRPLTSKEAAKRANEVYRMSLESRLGIPITIHDESCHGLISNGATSFPQAIGLAAMWDPTMMSKVARAISEETRARGVRHVLAPVINVIRDARWGRVEETYGEDPLLTSRMGVAYVKAFETNGVMTTPKHYIINAWDGGRDSHSVQISERALREIYLPPFKAVIQEGGARSIMPSYNSVNGRAASASHWLLTEILRGELGFKGFAASDYGAVSGVLWAHRNAADDEDCAAQCINAGMDMEWPNVEVWGKGLDDAVKHGKVSMKTIDQSVRRVLRAKFEIGLFENAMVDEQQVDNIVQSPAHRQIAVEAAQKAMVLLRNEKATLPLSKDLKSIALIGPSAAKGMPLGGYSGWNQPTVSVLDGIKAKVGPNVNVEWVKGAELGSTGSMPPIPSWYMRTPDGQEGLKGEYFANETLSGTPALVRVDKGIAFDWVDDSPDAKLPANGFSIRWTGTLIAPTTGDYAITVTADDGVRLYIDGKKVVDDWTEHAAKASKVVVHLETGKPIPVKIEYFEKEGQASMELGWGNAAANDSQIEQAVELAKKSDVAIVVAGIREGEGQDRAFLDLPGNQEALINAVAATGKPVVVVLIAGAPVTMRNWVDNVGAILDAWYPGQEGGTAIADVLFGDVNPGGKLPMTFPLSVSQCPTYYNLEPSGRGYDYVDLTGKPQFAFGHGLSYTTFQYSNLRVTPNRIGNRDNVTVSFDVENTGKVVGDEVPQLYIHDLVASITRPLKELRDFVRITLKPGEKKTITFTLKPEQLSFLDANMKPVVEPGKFDVMVGSSSEDIRLKGSFEVQKGKR
jgi:beta-glucosidase